MPKASDWEDTVIIENPESATTDGHSFRASLMCLQGSVGAYSFRMFSYRTSSDRELICSIVVSFLR